MTSYLAGNGQVSNEEFQQTFTAEFGGTIDQANKVFGKLDKDGSGDISLEVISALFKEMDTNGEILREFFRRKRKEIKTYTLKGKIKRRR